MSASLTHRLHDRLLELHAERPDLAPALDLQRTLLSRDIELMDLFLAGGLPRLSLPGRYLAAKLRDGIPALHQEPVPIPQQLLTLAMRDFCERLMTGRTEPAARALQASGYRAALRVDWTGGRPESQVEQLFADCRRDQVRRQLSNARPWPELSRRLWQHLLDQQGVEPERRWPWHPRR